MDTQEALNIIKLIWPLVVLQYTLAAWAIVDLVRHKKTKNLSMVTWIIIVLFVNLIGPISYFLIGRAEEQ